jgi:hypothetical protein
MYLRHWWYQWPCRCGGTMRSALPNGAHPGLHSKPLDAAIRRVPVVLYRPPAAAIVDNLNCKHKTTNNKLLLASNYGIRQLLVVYENFIPPNGPSTQLIDGTSCVKMWDSPNGAEELTHISSYQQLLVDKNWRSYKPSKKIIIKVGACMHP